MSQTINYLSWEAKYHTAPNTFNCLNFSALFFFRVSALGQTGMEEMPNILGISILCDDIVKTDGHIPGLCYQ